MRMPAVFKDVWARLAEFKAAQAAKRAELQRQPLIVAPPGVAHRLIAGAAAISERVSPDPPISTPVAGLAEPNYQDIRDSAVKALCTHGAVEVLLLTVFGSIQPNAKGKRECDSATIMSKLQELEALLKERGITTTFCGETVARVPAIKELFQIARARGIVLKGKPIAVVAPTTIKVESIFQAMTELKLLLRPKIAQLLSLQQDRIGSTTITLDARNYDALVANLTAYSKTHYRFVDMKEEKAFPSAEPQDIQEILKQLHISKKEIK